MIGSGGVVRKTVPSEGEDRREGRERKRMAGGGRATTWALTHPSSQSHPISGSSSRCSLGQSHAGTPTTSRDRTLRRICRVLRPSRRAPSLTVSSPTATGRTTTRRSRSRRLVSNTPPFRAHGSLGSCRTNPEGGQLFLHLRGYFYFNASRETSARLPGQEPRTTLRPALPRASGHPTLIPAIMPRSGRKSTRRCNARP